MIFLMYILKFSIAIGNNPNTDKTLLSQDYPFSKSLLSFHNGICNPNLHRRNLKVYDTLMFSWTFVMEHLWEYWAWIWHGGGILCFCNIGTQGYDFSFQKKKWCYALIWLTLVWLMQEALPSVFQAVCFHKSHSVYGEEDFLCHTPDKLLYPFK